jgi:hypothetical protein
VELIAQIRAMSENISASYALQIVGFKFCVSIAVFACLECAVAIVVNPLAVYIIAKHAILMRSPTNIFIISASISDIMYAIALLLYEATIFEGLEDRTGVPVGLSNRLAYAFTSLSMIGSMITTMFIAIERTIATYRPFKYKKWVTPKRAVMIISATWLYLLAVIPGLVIKAFVDSPYEKKRVLAGNIQEAYPGNSFRFYVSMHIYVSLVVSIVAYSCISRAVFKQTRNTALMTGKSKDERLQRQSLKVTKMSMGLLSMLLLCWAPFAITNMIVKYPDYETEPDRYKLHRAIAHSTVLCFSAYSYLNIIVYAANHADFKRVIRGMLGMPSNRVGDDTTETHTSNAWIHATTPITDLTCTQHMPYVVQL